MTLPDLQPQWWLPLLLAAFVSGALICLLWQRVRYQAQAALWHERLQTQLAELEAQQATTAQAQDEARQLQQQLHEAAIASAALHARLAGLEQEQRRLLELEQRQLAELAQQRSEQVALKENLSRNLAQLEAERRQSAEKLAVLTEAKDQLRAEFKNLANEIFEDKSKRFTEQNRLNLENVLKPLSGQLSDFQKRIDETYDRESKDRFSLVKEIKNLQELNNRISQDALNLTNALRGENKTQGSWGEMTLERILEASGLAKGREYDVQVSLRTEDGARLQPDVIVHLPEEKDVIIDSKVTLTAYYAYSSATTEEERETAAKAHLQSVQNHIRNLGSKDYQRLPGVRSLDFVLLFLAVEDAFHLAVQRDPRLFDTAFSRNIILVGPSTLLATLKTIHYIWRNEYQSRNALEIARQAGDLYDKFVNFVGDIEDVGQRLDKAQDAYRKAHNKLSSGHGNLVARAERLKQLGAKASKQLPKQLLQLEAGALPIGGEMADGGMHGEEMPGGEMSVREASDGEVPVADASELPTERG